MENEPLPRSEEPDQESIDRSEEALRKITEKEDAEDRHFNTIVDELAREAFKKKYQQLKKIDSDAAESYKEHVKWTRQWAQQMAEEIDHLFGGKSNK